MLLEEIAVKYGSDKQRKNGHGYTEFYEKYFQDIKDSSLNILELGVREGYSLKMWNEYFTKSIIWGIDNNTENKCPDSFNEPRVKFFIGDQTDEKFLSKLNDNSGGFDIIIDDASHISPYTIKSFQILYPLLNFGGLYIIEDLHVCTLPEYLPYGIDAITFLKNQNLKSFNLISNKIAFIKKV
jgi:cephalosporin hydroxylase